MLDNNKNKLEQIENRDKLRQKKLRASSIMSQKIRKVQINLNDQKPYKHIEEVEKKKRMFKQKQESQNNLETDRNIQHI